jgi:MoxR-like ATPase
MYAAVREETDRVLIGNDRIIEGLMIALLSDGNVLLEGVPGIAKTTAAQVFARASGLEHTRIQMTPDLLPADITGTEIYREPTGEFEIKKGPIFANVVLADEINRATPKTQSALLEAMAEGTVTIDGTERALPSPFLVVATQNPIEMEGTFTLPEAQRDRFQQKLRIGTPDIQTERAILDRFDTEPALGPDTIEQVITPDQLKDARAKVKEVHVAESIKEYALEIVAATREHTHVEHGASPRASLAFLNAGKARAAIHNREYVIPDDIKALAEPVLIHRLILNADAEISGTTAAEVVSAVLEATTPPAGDAEEGKQDPTGAPQDHETISEADSVVGLTDGAGKPPEPADGTDSADMSDSSDS